MLPCHEYRENECGHETHNCLYSAHREAWLLGAVMAGVGLYLLLESHQLVEQQARDWQARVCIARGIGANQGMECGLSTEERLQPWAVPRGG